MVEKESLMEQLTSAEDHSKSEREKSLANLREELENKTKDELDKLRMEGELPTFPIFHIH